jgi:hypothetical protein
MNKKYLGCSSLAEITCLATYPPMSTPKVDKSIRIYVPKGNVLKYKASSWKDFVNIREIE